MAILTSPGADQEEARINQTWFVAHEATPPEEFDLNLYPLHRRKQTRHTSPDVLSKALANEAVEAHCEEKQSETGLLGYYVEKEKLSAKEPDLFKLAGDGFIIFDSRVALIDEFGGDGIVRGRVTMNESEIQGLEKAFQRLKVHAARLNKKLLKTSVAQAVALDDKKLPASNPTGGV